MVIPPQVRALCTGGQSVSVEVAKNPELPPGKAVKQLFGVDAEEEIVGEKLKDLQIADDDLQHALECGKWGDSRPSELFLRMYHDVLCTLEKNPMAGVCSPSLIGSSGVCPLTIVAPIPDICRHMSNLIARAEREVFLATNFWMHSEPTKLICNALKEFSKRCGERGVKGVVKIIYDRANLKQFVNNHQTVPVKEYADPKGKVQIPPPEELPHLHLEVVNYHRPIFGTFHCKYMIVDRKIAIIQSNNIQENDNCEMMAQLEGPIVDSFYDVALISWHNELKPPLPCLSTPAVTTGLPTFESNAHAAMFDQQGKMIPVQQNPNPVPKNQDNLAAVARDGLNSDLAQHTSSDPHYDKDIASEVLRSISFMNPREGERRVDAVTRLLNTTFQKDTKASAPEISEDDMMTPLIPIPPHQPFPIAMVNREPWGGPDKRSVFVPQNEAFLSGLRNAKQDVFIQTPNLNAAALIPEILATCRRKVHVAYFYCLGYNDAGELLPGQDGTNEMVAHHLYNTLEKEYHDYLDIYAYVAKDQIHPIHNKHKKRSCHVKVMIIDGHVAIQGNGNQDTQSYYHSQEINVMLDSELVCQWWMDGLLRNQNTHIYGKVLKEGEQSGCWVDPQTSKQAEGAIGVDPGKFAWTKGITGSIQRVRGAGGF